MATLNTEMLVNMATLNTEMLVNMATLNTEMLVSSNLQKFLFQTITL